MDGPPPGLPLVTGAALLYITITSLVYHLILVPHASSPFAMTGGPVTGWQAVTNQVLHTVTPIAAVIDWLFLTAPGRLRLRMAATWLLYPLTYLAVSLGRGELILPGTPGRYLYSFLDVERHGYKSVLGNPPPRPRLLRPLRPPRGPRPRPPEPHPPPRQNRISSPATGGLK